MKAKRTTVLALLTALSLTAGCAVLATPDAETVTAELSPHFTIIVDGIERDFYNADGEEVHPILYEGTTYLPLRAIGELMDKNVNWDQSALTITLSGTRGENIVTGEEDTSAVKEKVSAQIRYDFTIVVDGIETTFKDVNGSTVYPLLYNGSTYLPIRAIGELMGKSVTWDAENYTIYIGGENENSGSLVTDADTFDTAAPAESTSAPPVETAAPRDEASQYKDGSKPSGTNERNESAAPEVSISEDEAKAIALEHAGLTEADVTFTKVKTDYDDGAWEYDIEFRYGRTEYEYEINAVTGEIRSIDIDKD